VANLIKYTYFDQYQQPSHVVCILLLCWRLEILHVW